jgi:hypothetical protein
LPDTLIDSVALEAEPPLLGEELLLLDAPLSVDVATVEPVLLATVSLEGDALAGLAVDAVVVDALDAAVLDDESPHAASASKRMLTAA